MEAYCHEDKASALESQPGEPRSLTIPELRRKSLPQPIVVPPSVSQTLSVIAMSRYGSLATVPIIDGLNEIVFYLDHATQWHERRKAPAGIRNNHSCKLGYVMWAHWLLRAIQAGDEYQVATTQLANGDPQLRLPYYGMTLPRFFSTLEEVSNYLTALCFTLQPSKGYTNTRSHPEDTTRSQATPERKVRSLSCDPATEQH